MRINHNVAALNTHRQLTMNNSHAAKNLEKLSSGLRVNRAGDDAAGLAISEKMRGQIRGLDMAAKNALDGISLIQTAEGALNETHSILQRMRELAVQSSNDTNSDEDRQHIDAEIIALVEEIDRISDTTQFNGKNLLNGDLKGFILHIGANAQQSISLAIEDMDSVWIGVDQLDLTTQPGSDAAITAIDAGLNIVSTQRGLLGAVHNRLEHTINNLGTASENLTEAESRIRDVDMAKEMMEFTKNSILTQAAQAMLAQANQLPQGVLQLLR